MRFMMIVRATERSEAGEMPSQELIASMMAYNEELAKAGLLIDLGGLQPSSAGAKVRFTDGSVTVVDGPFAETKELIAGYWIVEAKSLAEVIDWAKRCPNPAGSGNGVIEIRPFFALEDFGDDQVLEKARQFGEHLTANAA